MSEYTTDTITPRAAKSIIFKALHDEGFDPYAYALRARTVDFTDLARAKCIFVRIGGWKPDPRWDKLKQVAISNGFRIE